MSIVIANEEDFDIIKNITHTTIKHIYPRYYPVGAVKFFINHHNDESILTDIKNGKCYIITNENSVPVGTVTVKGNELLRLFVLPEYQKKGYGKNLLDFSERIIAEKHDCIVISASLPAKNIYLKRGYKETEYHTILTENDDFLCYDEMIKYIK